MPHLNRHSVPTHAILGASAPTIPGIVHLGLGNFHRAHAAAYTANALAAEPGAWGIAGYANRNIRLVDAMQAQDGMYALLEVSDVGQRAHIVDVHRGFGVAASDPGAFVRAVAAATTRILTITVSEYGYYRSSVTAGLDIHAPELATDLAHPEQPRTPVGLIAAGLRERAASGEPLSVLSCDNLRASGDTTRNVVTEFLRATRASEDVLRYVCDQVAFPNAMVDRIVPATAPDTPAIVAELLGVADCCPVRSEQFSMWVLEDHFPGGRPQWEAGGAMFHDDVEAYELVKLRVLNGSHSLIAYLGVLDGHRTIPASWRQPHVQEAVLTAVNRDIMPTLTVPTGLDVDAYVTAATHRWSNDALADSTVRVGSLGSGRLAQRIPDAVEHAREHGRLPHLLALTVAAWIAAAVPPAGFDPGPVAAEMDDPALPQIRAQIPARVTVAEHVRATLASACLTTSLAEHRVFVERVAELVGVLVAHGTRAAVHDAITATASTPDPPKERP